MRYRIFFFFFFYLTKIQIGAYGFNCGHHFDVDQLRQYLSGTESVQNAKKLLLNFNIRTINESISGAMFF